MTEGGDFKREDLRELAGIGATVGAIEIPTEVEYKDYFFEIDENYEITVIGKTQGEKPTIDGEVITSGIVEQGGKVEIKITAAINEGSIISIEAINGATIKTDVSDKEKVFEVDANGKYYFKAKADNGRSAIIEITVNTIIEKPIIEIKDISQVGFTIVVTNNYTEELVTEYRYYVSGEIKSSGTTEKEFEVTGLSEETEYTNIYVEAYIGETKLTSETKTVTTKGEIVEIVWTNDTTANRTIDGNTATYKNPIIPVGFSAINTEDAKWNKENGESSEWNNGLVIKNATDNNEFVWVPVDGTNVPYAKWCTDGYSYEACTDTEAISGIDISNNVTDYGGFWVARYEAGLPTTIDQTMAHKDIRNVSGKPLSIAGAIPWNCIDLNNSKANAQSMYSNNYVQSGLLNGTQWDTIMEWINDGGKSVTSSEEWGNFNDTSVTLRGGKYAYVSRNDGTNWISALQTSEGWNEIIKTGASNDTKAKNIYDIAGNVSEWICEIRTDLKPLYRGGRYNNTSYNECAADRSMGQDATYTFEGLGFRAMLYVK